MALDPSPPDATAAEASDALVAVRDAYRRHAWREAFDGLAAADVVGSLLPADLERLAEAAFWTGRFPARIAAYERAYRGYVEAGNQRRAGFVALVLSLDYTHKLQHAVAAGWFNRAQRLLDEEPDSVEHGYLALVRVSAAVARGDREEALALARVADEIARRHGDRDLHALALQVEGCARVMAGDVDRGLALLDEATVAAVSGELGPRATALVYCGTISTCRDLADYRRAGEWTEAATRWCERQAISGFPGVCRVHRAEIMRLRGAWAQAEQEVRRACDELREFSLETAGEAFYELGQIRLHVGDLEGAAEAFRQAHELGRRPEPGLSQLRLAEGKVEAAAASIRRALAAEPSARLTRARLLPAQVEIALAAGEIELARATAVELEEIASTYRTPAFSAEAACARGAVQVAEGDPSAAASSLRRGWQIWKELDAPYEAARAQAALGEAYRLEGDADAAVLEIEAARAAFERLGAAPDERKAAQRLAELGGPDGRRASAATRRDARTFMFTDIEGSTALVEAIGDEAWSDLLRWHDQTLRALFSAHGGVEIKQAGDGFFVGFADPGSGIDCAVAIQRTLAEHRRAHGFAPPVRIGLHATEADRRGLDYGGKGVHEAARIAALARGGEILASEATLAACVAGGARHPLSEPRSVELKGLSSPVTVVAVAWRETALPAGPAPI